MRPDFGKVVIERPRRGSRSENKHTREKVKPHLWEHYEDGGHDQGHHRSMFMGSKSCRMARNSRAVQSGKDLSDLLGPLHNYMRKMVGHHYNEAHSALCAVLPKNNEPLRHIVRDHFSFTFDHNRSCWTSLGFWLDEHGFIHDSHLEPVPERQAHTVPEWWVPLPPNPPKEMHSSRAWLGGGAYQMSYRTPGEHKPVSCEKCRLALKEHNERHIPARRLAALYSSGISNPNRVKVRVAKVA